MKRTIQLGVAIATGLLATVPALAAEPAGDAARRCAQILGERERLACFDRAFTAGPETAALAESRAAAPVVAPAAAPAAAVPVAPPARVAPAAVAPVVVAAPVAVASTASAATTVAPSLGDEQLRKYDKETAEKSGEPKSLTAKVTALKLIREDTWRLDLDNGQVWQQMDMSGTFHPGVGDTVQIQRKIMGGYTLALAGDKKSPWIRVSRLQ